MAVIDEPAVARAIDRCLTARSLADRRGPVTRVHPRPCGWCDWPLPDLRRLLDGFNAWAGWDERRRTYERHEIRVWTENARRDPAAAEAEIVAAQELVPDSSGIEAPGVGGSIPPAEHVAEDRPAATFPRRQNPNPKGTKPLTAATEPPAHEPGPMGVPALTRIDGSPESRPDTPVDEEYPAWMS